jgi:hypothetical protein
MEAIRDPEGREMVESLLTEAEWLDRRGGQNLNAPHLEAVRRRLGFSIR